MSSVRGCALPTLLLISLWAKLVFGSWSLAPGPFPTQTAVPSATLAVLLLIAAPLLCLSSRRRTVVLIALDALLSLVVVADHIHFRYFGDVISVEELLHAPQLLSLGASVVSLVRPIDGLYFADICVVLAYAAWRRLKASDTRPLARMSGWAALAAMAFGAAVAVPTVQLVMLDPEEVFDYATTRREVVGAIGVLPYHAYDLAVYLRYPLLGRVSVGGDDLGRVRDFLKRHRQPPPSPLFGVSRKANVIMVMVESLQAFPIGLRVQGEPVTPNLSAFAAESLSFDNFYDDTYMGTTSDGTFTSMQSLHPLPAGAVATRYSANSYRGLPAILAAQGYTTLSACAEPGYFWNKLQMHPKLGFERSYFRESLGEGEELGLGLADRELFAKMVPVLARQQEPFAALLTTLSSHHPYRIPEVHQSLEMGRLENTPIGDYLQSIHYVDRAFGEFIRQLRVRGLLDRSVVAVFGDHHAWLEQSPEWAETLGFGADDEYSYWRARKRLPLLIRLPGKAGASADAAGGHVDIAPTLLALLGIDSGDTVMLGRDLTGGERGLAVFRDGSFTDGRYDFIRHLGESTSQRCYQVATRDQVDCGLLEKERAAADERLTISDLIVRGDLIPQLRQNLRPRLESVDAHNPSPPGQ